MSWLQVIFIYSKIIQFDSLCTWIEALVLVHFIRVFDFFFWCFGMLLIVIVSVIGEIR